MMLSRSQTAKIKKIETKAKRYFCRSIGYDKRCRFEDFSSIKPEKRIPKSPILQFYSSVDNIGNYLPVLGMREMLGHVPDTWCIHDKSMDFDFINRNYKCIVIGGAGLLDRCFQPFWAKFLQECQLPTTIWGIGACVRDGEQIDSEYRRVVSEVSRRCDLINIRDNFTAKIFGIDNYSISPCPTVFYLNKYPKFDVQKSNGVLYSSHERIVNDRDKSQIKNTLDNVFEQYKFTDNMQHPYLGLDEIIENFYVGRKLVVTTRLHGAIIAYGLGIPYVAIAKDRKVEAFVNEFGNGCLLEDIQQLNSVVGNDLQLDLEMQEIALKSVIDFGEQAKNWANQVCGNLSSLSV